MTFKPLLLDLFCGAGGAAVGYAEAGFRLIGVDIEPQPNYPFEFYEHDALTFLKLHDVRRLVAVHASPPCQGYSVTKYLYDMDHPLLIDSTRKMLSRLNIPYVIENVQGAKDHMIDPVTLCGSFFGLRVRRHRLFETNWNCTGSPCVHGWQETYKPYRIHHSVSRNGERSSGVAPVFGGNPFVSGNSLLRKSVATGIDWMTEPEINEAIPPAYTRHIGRQLMRELRRRRTV